MTKIPNESRQYDLEERTFQFAKDVRLWAKRNSKSFINFEDFKQVIRASGSVGANYIEANEALSKKDFLMRIRISRKESKESAYWIRLILETGLTSENEEEGKRLLNEAIQLKKIFSSIIENSPKRSPN